jgi:hypothetical protein
VLAEDGVARRLHGPHIQWGPHVPAGRGTKRARPPRTRDVIAIGTRQRPTPGIEPRRPPSCFPHDYARGKHGVHRALDALEVGPDGGVEANNLAPSVDAGVGPACAHQLDRVAQDPLQSLCEGACHGLGTLLARETVEPRPQVGNDKARPPLQLLLATGASRRSAPSWGGLRGASERAQTSSMRAMGALSP